MERGRGRGGARGARRRGRKSRPRAAPRAGPRERLRAGREGGRCQRGTELSETRRRRGKVQCHGNQGSEQVHPGRGGCGAPRQGGSRSGRPRATCPRGEGRPCRPSAGVVSAECRGAGGPGGGLAACSDPEAAAPRPPVSGSGRGSGGWLLGGAARDRSACGLAGAWKSLGRKRWRSKKEGTSWVCTRLDGESPSMSQHPRALSPREVGDALPGN